MKKGSGRPHLRGPSPWSAPMADLSFLQELPKTANANIKNALFVGSTAELQKMLNKKSVETNVERKKENENFEGKNITPEKTDTKD